MSATSKIVRRLAIFSPGPLIEHVGNRGDRHANCRRNVLDGHHLSVI
jgi:hypothetical protein